MALTRDFRITFKERMDRDPEFRSAMLSEIVTVFLAGDLDIAKPLLRDYINATVGFAALSSTTSIPPKSLMRMVGKRGNPRADNLFAILRALQLATGVHLDVRVAA